MSVTLDHLGQLWGRLSPCVRPKGAHKQEIHIFVGDFAYQRSHEDAKRACNPAGRTARRSFLGHFGVSLGSVWVSVGDVGSLDGHFAIIVESLWVREGPFSKNIQFPNRF